MDRPCAVEGYQSDISRTFVFGEPNKQQSKNLEYSASKDKPLRFETAPVGCSLQVRSMMQCVNIMCLKV